jgi:hypothetical protein
MTIVSIALSASLLMNIVLLDRCFEIGGTYEFSLLCPGGGMILSRKRHNKADLRLCAKSNKDADQNSSNGTADLSISSLSTSSSSSPQVCLRFHDIS